MPSPGGSEVYTETVRAGLTSAGDEVRLLTSGAGSAGHGSADYVAYGTTNVAAQALLQIVNPFAARTARLAIARFRPDVAFVHLFAFHLSPSVIQALSGVPTVLSVHDYKIVCPLGSKLLPTGTLCSQPAGRACLRSGCLNWAHWLRDQVRYAAIARSLRAPSLMLACSRHVQRVLADNGIDADVLTLPVAQPRAAFRRAPAPHPQFVFCGRFAPEKGVSLLVRAFARLLARVPAARLTLCGDGPIRREVDAAIRVHGLERQITVTGWLPHDRVDEHLQDAWALVAPSMWAEPLGLVGVEAVVRGVPVVATRTGGFGETIEDGVSGLLVPNGDEDALAAALERVATGEAFPAHALDAEVVARACETHGVEQHVAELRAHFRRVCSRSS